MAYFGSDGNNDAAGINPPAVPEGSTNYINPAQDVLVACGGQVSAGGTPTTVSAYLFSAFGSTAADHYFAVYKGGTATDPTGATRIGVTANITTTFPVSPAWYDFALTSTSAFATSDYVWIALLGRGANASYTCRPYTVGNEGSGLTYREDWVNKGGGTYDYVWSVTDGSSGAPASTFVSGGAFTSSMPVASYITYTAGGATVATSLLRPRQSIAFSTSF